MHLSFMRGLVAAAVIASKTSNVLLGERRQVRGEVEDTNRANAQTFVLTKPTGVMPYFLSTLSDLRSFLFLTV